MGLAGRVRSRVAREVTWRIAERSYKVDASWHRKPALEAGGRTCLFVAYARDGQLSDRSLHHARSWSAANFQTILIVIADTPETVVVDPAKCGFASGILIRANRGYDFGGWSSAITRLPELRDQSLVVTANDSLFGPFQGFDSFVERAASIDADMIGIVESREIRRHYQSFMLMFRPRALRSEAFHRFWRNLRAGGRDLVIEFGETRLLSAMERSGLRCAALFPAQRDDNPTVVAWRDTVDRGFPFVKVQVQNDMADASDRQSLMTWMREKGLPAEAA